MNGKVSPAAQQHAAQLHDIFMQEDGTLVCYDCPYESKDVDDVTAHLEALKERIGSLVKSLRAALDVIQKALE